MKTLLKMVRPLNELAKIPPTVHPMPPSVTTDNIVVFGESVALLELVTFAVPVAVSVVYVTPLIITVPNKYL